MMCLLLLSLCATSNAVASGTATITGVGDLPGGAYESLVTGVSADGGTVFGNSNSAAPKSQAFRWTEEFGIEGLGTDPEGTSAVGATLYGRYIVVTSLTDLWEWFFWTEPNGLERVTHGEVRGISEDGSVAASNDTRGALRWTAATGSIVLTPFGSDTVTTAMGISADGAYIVGVSHDEAGLEHHAVRWNADGVPEALGDLPGGDVYAWANAASSDGSVVVGSSKGSGGDEAFRWTAETGMQGLGVLAGGLSHTSSAVAISPDGVVVLGQSSSIDGLVPFVWDAHHGIRRLSSALATDYGLDLSTTGWWLWDVKGISADRRTVVGTGLRNLLEPPSYQPAYEGYVVRLSTPLPEPNGLALGGIAVAALAALRGRSRRVALLVTLFAATLAAGAARAQVDGTECGCTETGAYVAPDPGVRPAVGTLDATASVITSPGGRWRLERQGPAGPATPAWTVVRASSGAIVHPGIVANVFLWSPDDDRLLTLYQFGSLGAEMQEFRLWDLATAGGAVEIWATSGAAWESVRKRFSADGSGFLFAGARGQNELTVSALFVPTRALFDPGPVLVADLPADIDAELPENVGAPSDPGIAGWGFGPDPARLVFAWRAPTGPDIFALELVDLSTGTDSATELNRPSASWGFSPCGDVLGLVLEQDFALDPVDTVLYATRRPNLQAAPLGQTTFSFDTVELRTNASSHFGLLGGNQTPIASNTADDACPTANQLPSASFTPPSNPLAEQAASFTDTSSDTDGSVVSWHWDFGDGATSSARNPAHTYAGIGEYTVRLTVTDDQGGQAFAERVIRVCGTLATPPGKLLFGRPASTSVSDLFALDTGSQDLAQVTSSSASPSGTNGGARWSPDGTQIAFASESQNGIWVMNADGANRRRVTDGTVEGIRGHSFPIWSPDGQWLAFRVSQRPDFFDGDPGIYWVRPDGTGLVKTPGTTLFDTASDVHPALAGGCGALPPAARGPGCYTLLYVDDPRETASGPFLGTIREMRGDGSGMRTLVPQLGLYGTPRYAPDASKIAYLRSLGLVAQSGGGLNQIWMLDLTTPGASQRVVVDDPDAFDELPVWSPDGSSIAYTKGIRTPGSIVDRDIHVTDFLGCNDGRVIGQPGVHEYGYDWLAGSVTQALGSISGVAQLHTSPSVQVPTQPLSGVVIELSGDATGTTTTGADGSFSFANLPIGGDFTIRVVSAPDAANTTSDKVFTDLLGGAANLYFRIVPDQVRLEGSVVLAGSLSGIAGATVTVEGPGGPYQTTTGADGRYALDVPFRAQLSVRAEAPGYRIEPATRDLFTAQEFAVLGFGFQAYALPPEGRVVFTSSRDGNDEIYAVDLDGRNLANLTNDPANDAEPAISPDGTRIAFASDRNGAFELFVMDGGGSVMTPLGVGGREPAWSADGASLAFATGGGLRSLDLASGAVTELTSAPSDASPRWSPDGRPVLSFEREFAPGDWAWIDLDLSDPTSPIEEWPRSNTGFVGDPAYRPGGDGHAYVTADGVPGGTRYVRTFLPSAFADYGLYAGQNPSWSPDGQRIVADDGNGNVWWTQPDGSGGQRYVTLSGSDRDPDWGPPYVPACSNGLDDDGDGLADLDDPGCSDPQDSSERGIDSTCDDGLDQDGDGYADFPRDPGCDDAYDFDETSFRFACDDGIDDDGDGLVDMADPGCPFPYASPEDPPCDNYWDDDGDGLTDFEDSSCSRAWPYWEREPACGLGGEFVLVYAALATAVQRRRAAQRSTT